MRAHRPFLTSRASEFGRLGTRLQGLEQLENRNLLTVSIGNIQLATDTGVSSTDRISTAAALSGTTTGSPQVGGLAQVQFDHNGDGVVNGTAAVSSGAFSYNPLAVDSTLENWEGALTIRYRTRELNGYGGEVSLGDWQNFNMTLDRKAPTTPGFAPVEVNEGAANTQINLGGGFDDGVTADASLAYQVVSNSYPGLFDSVSVSGGTLTLDYHSTGFGGANIVIRAIDQAGNSKDTTVAVTVYHVNTPPVITGFTVSEIEDNMYEFSGSASDAEQSLEGYYVMIYLTELDEYIYAEIQASGGFSTSYSTTAFLGDFATAITADAEDLYSEEVMALI